MSWAAAQSTARDFQSVTIPSQRAAATWQSAMAIEPIARTRWTWSSSTSPRSAKFRAWADSTATTSSLPSSVRRSGGRSTSGWSLTKAPSPLVARHSSFGPRSKT